MPDRWIDDHTGDELSPRPEFRAELRGRLGRELRGTRRAMRIAAWATAAAAIIAVVAVVATRDGGTRTKPSDSSVSASGPTTPDTDTTPATVPGTNTPSGDELARLVADRRWYVAVVDGAPATVNAWFELRSGGAVVGSDGCNDYGTAVPTEGAAWTFVGTTLRLATSFESTAVLCEKMEPLTPPIDGATFSFVADGSGGVADSIRIANFFHEFVVTPEQIVDLPIDPASVVGTDRAALLAEALWNRAKVNNSFGGDPNAVTNVRIIDRVGVAGSDGFIGNDGGSPLTQAERDAIVARFAPNAVTFVARADIVYPMVEGDLPVLEVAEPAIVDGAFTVTSSLTCGSLCATGGAVEAVRQPDGTWQMGSPVGPSWIS